MQCQLTSQTARQTRPAWFNERRMYITHVITRYDMMNLIIIFIQQRQRAYYTDGLYFYSYFVIVKKQTNKKRRKRKPYLKLERNAIFPERGGKLCYVRSMRSTHVLVQLSWIIIWISICTVWWTHWTVWQMWNHQCGQWPQCHVVSRPDILG